MHLIYIQCFSSSRVISTSTLRSRAQRGYVAWVPDLHTDVLIPEPARGIIPPCFLKSSNPIKGPPALSVTHTLTPLPPDGTAGAGGPGLGLVEAISSVFNTNPIPTPVMFPEPGRRFRLLHTQTRASTLLEWLTLSPPAPALGGTVKAEQKRDACCLPTTSPPRTFPRRQCGGCAHPIPCCPHPQVGGWVRAERGG